jgi:hypothetical protein
MRSKHTMSTRPANRVFTPEELADIARHVLKRPDGEAMLRRACQGFVLGLGGWSLSDERGDQIVCVAHDQDDESTEARNARILAEYEDVLAAIEAFYGEMDRQLPGDHDEEVPDWEDWTLKLKARLHPFFRRWDQAMGRVPPERRSSLSKDALFDLLPAIEHDLLPERLNVEWARYLHEHWTEMVGSLRSWQLNRLDRHLRVIAEDLWIRPPSEDRPFTRKDRRPRNGLACCLVARRFENDDLDPDTIATYVRQARNTKLP